MTVAVLAPLMKLISEVMLLKLQTNHKLRNIPSLLRGIKLKERMKFRPSIRICSNILLIVGVVG